MSGTGKLTTEKQFEFMGNNPVRPRLRPKPRWPMPRADQVLLLEPNRKGKWKIEGAFPLHPGSGWPTEGEC